ncbi:MAG: RHS repeat protein, partial [Verrucomicrobiota bacterium]|nr:RHS repeat protein [Verrucomicrobiota bacterium]
MNKIWLFCLLFISVLFAGNPDTAIVIDSVSSNVCGIVHAPTGQAFLQRTDAVIAGYEPIPIARAYVSENSGALNWEGGWAVFPHVQFSVLVTDKGLVAVVHEPEGSVVRYRLQEHSDRMLPDLETFHAPPFHREISGRTDVRNSWIHLHKSDRKGQQFSGATLHLGNGGRRIYQFKRMEHHPIHWIFLLEEEIKPNGNKVLYSHDEDERVKKISTWNPKKTKEYASLSFDYGGKKTKDHNCDLTGSDGTVLHYDFWRPEDKHLHNFFYFEEVSGEGVVLEKISYDIGYKKAKTSVNKTRGPFVDTIAIGGELAFELSYYYPGQNTPSFGDPVFLKNARDHICDKVMDLKEPVGPEGAFITTHSFRYEHSTNKGPGVTKVRDVLGNETHYFFDEHFKPSKTEFYSLEGLIRTEKFLWKEQDLEWHILEDPTGQNSSARHFEYETQGNVKKQTLYGNLTGRCTVPFDIENLQNGIESYSTTYDYSKDGFNLPVLKEEDNGLKTTYSYKSGTDLLETKTVYDRAEFLGIRYQYHYNEDNFLFEEILDDGYHRKIIRYTPNENNFPETIEEKALNLTSGEEILLQKRILYYNARHQVEKEDVFDADGVRRYSTKTGYKKGLIDSSSDPLGQTTTFKYNGRHQLKERHKEGSPTETFVYDPAGRLKEKHLSAEENQVTTYEYNALHHRLSETDSHEAKTILEPNRFGAPCKITAPLAPGTEGIDIERKTILKYDFLGREIFRKDSNGDETNVRYNAYGNPICVLRTDGAEESFFYFPNGALQEHVDVEDVRTKYEYDVLGRPLSKKVYSSKEVLLSSDSKTYEGLHLDTHTDALDYITTYTYDFAGRKSSEERASLKTEYRYDSLGVLNRTIQDNLVLVTEQDLLGRIIEERKESLIGQVLYKKRFIYKDAGHTVEEITYPKNQEAITTSRFDSFGRLVEIEDPYGHTTFYEYTLKPHTKTTTDALGRQKIETYNALGKFAHLKQVDEHGKIIALEEYFYDQGLNLSRQASSIYEKEAFLKTIETRWIYGPLNRLEKLIEAANTTPRTTRYTYKKKGLLFQTTKPSGTIL